MGNTVQLLKDGQPVFPVTDVSLVMGLQDAIKLPPVKVTTLPTASADTAGKMYYVGPDGNDEYERYITSAVGGSYSWIDLGDTSIPLPSIADNLTTADANTALSANQGVVLAGQIGQLDQEVIGEQVAIPLIETGKYIKMTVGSAISSPTSSQTMSYYQTTVSPGDLVMVNGTGGSTPRLWGFIDSNNVVLSVAAAGSAGTNLLLTAPENAAGVIINSSDGRTSYTLKGTSVNAKIINLQSDKLNVSSYNTDKDLAERTPKDGMAFEFTGAGSTVQSVNFLTTPGRRYRIYPIPFEWARGTITASSDYVALYSVSNNVETSIFRRSGNSVALAPWPYDFTAIACDNYRLYFRADSGVKVNFVISDITDESFDKGIGIQSIMSANGGNYLIDDNLRNLDAQITGGNPVLKLLYFSDIHGSVDALNRLCYLRNKEYLYINDVLSGGDNVTDQPTDDYPFFDDDADAYATKILTVTGNHDTVALGQLMDQKDFYDLYFGDHAANWVGVTFPENAATLGLCYWYKDYSDQKVRLIGLDCMYWDDAQLAWLENTLASAASGGLHVVICVHYKLAYTRTPDNPFDTLYDLSSAFASRQIAAAVQDSIDNDGLNFVCYLVGHEHKDMFGKLADYPDQFLVGITKATPTVTDAWRSWDMIDRQFDALNVLAVDTTHKTFTVYRIGNNRDKFGRWKNWLVVDYDNGSVISQS